jgi:hypothetical protein
MRHRFQFSIRFLLVATVAVAAGAAAVRLEPSRQATFVVAFVTAFFTTSATVGAAKTRGPLRVFWLGAFVWLGVVTILAAIHLSSALINESVGMPTELYIAPGKFAALWVAAPLNGVCAAFLYWLFSPRRESDRFPVVTVATVLLVAFLGTFYGGMRFGELRERDRLDREQEAKPAEMGVEPAVEPYNPFDPPITAEEIPISK